MPSGRTRLCFIQICICRVIKWKFSTQDTETKERLRETRVWFQGFFRTQGLLPCSQHSAAGPNTRIDKSAYMQTSCFFRSILILPPPCSDLPSCLLPLCFPTRVRFSYLYNEGHAPLPFCHPVNIFR